MSIKIKGSEILAALRAQQGLVVAESSDSDSIEFSCQGRVYTIAMDTRSATIYLPSGDCAEIHFKDSASGVVASIVKLAAPSAAAEEEGVDDDNDNARDEDFNSSPSSQNYYEDTYMSRDASFDYAGGSSMPALLSNDIAAARTVYGEVTYRMVGSGYWVSAFLPIRSISDNAARAWGVNKNVPLEVRFEFDSANYPGLRVPKIQMFQKEEDSAIGKPMPLGQQLGRAVTNYLRRRWSSGAFAPLNLPMPHGLGGEDTNPQGKPLVESVKQQLIVNRSDLIHSLMIIGFEKDTAEAAALRCNDVPDAVAYILEIQANKPKTEPGKIGGDFFTNKLSEGDADIKKYVPYRNSEGFLVHVCKYILHRVPSASTYCVLCDEPHVFDCAMLRPAVCGRALCTFAYTDMKVGSDAAESVATDVGVVDLLVNIFIAAANSAAAEGTADRAIRMLNPYPSIEEPTKKGALALDPTKPKFAELGAIAAQLPTTEEILGSGSSDSLNKALDKRHRLAFPLFNWIINSNRSYLVKIDPIIPMMETSHQYLLLMSTPEKEGKFKQMKAKHGTKWAFHGSRTNNWHSILRNGLMNMSGTSYQLNGAAHGSGVYFAPQAATSLGYSGAGAAGAATPSTGKPEYLVASKMICLALCEIISTHVNDCGWCWTVADNDAIMTRFFFVYPQGTYGPGPAAAQSMDATLQAQVDVVMKRYGMS